MVVTHLFWEGLSAGFRWDYALSNNSGLAIGAEQFFISIQ